MYERLELERVKLQTLQIQVDTERFKKDYRFRCIDIAVNTGSDKTNLIDDAKKILAFVEGA